MIARKIAVSVKKKTPSLFSPCKIIYFHCRDPVNCNDIKYSELMSSSFTFIEDNNLRETCCRTQYLTTLHHLPTHPPRTVHTLPGLRMYYILPIGIASLHTHTHTNAPLLRRIRELGKPLLLPPHTVSRFTWRCSRFVPSATSDNRNHDPVLAAHHILSDWPGYASSHLPLQRHAGGVDLDHVCLVSVIFVRCDRGGWRSSMIRKGFGSSHTTIVANDDPQHTK